MVSASFPAYIESIDTTDLNGYSRDSLFKIANVSVFEQDSGKTMIGYDAGIEYKGYFNCAFDDLNKAPDTLKKASSFVMVRMNISYVILRLKDSTYTKMVLLSKISNSRYIYRQIANTTSKDRSFVGVLFNPATKFKPNNLYFSSTYNVGTTTYLSWEPPLPGNNHLLGYTVFISKNVAGIDTAKPINLLQWDSVAFTTNTFFTIINRGGYFNVVAVYREGQSEFLTGWVQLPSLNGISPSGIVKSDQEHDAITIRKTTAGYSFSFPAVANKAALVSAAIFDPAGHEVSPIIGNGNNSLLWNSPVEGVYAIRLTLTNGKSFARQFIVTK
jgi:hypothetical protein